MRVRSMVIATMMAAILTAAGIAIGPSASAIVYCPPNSYCVWTGTSATGHSYHWGSEFHNTGCHNLGIAPNGINFDNNIESAMTNVGSNDVMILFANPNCGGNHLVWLGGLSALSNLVGNGNVASSVGFY